MSLPLSALPHLSSLPSKEASRVAMLELQKLCKSFGGLMAVAADRPDSRLGRAAIDAITRDSGATAPIHRFKFFIRTPPPPPRRP